LSVIVFEPGTSDITCSRVAILTHLLSSRAQRFRWLTLFI